MIEFINLNKSFGKNLVLDNLNLNVSEGKISAVLGPNGSGKSTIIKCLLGLVLPESGQILFDGQPIRNAWQYRQKIDYLPQIARFPENLTTGELIKMITDIRQQQGDSEALIELFELSPFMHKKIRHLSGGTRQKVNILLTFMFNNPVIILDEPSSGLDPVAIIRLKDLIHRERDNGKTILFTSHIMSLVEDLADEIIFLLEGKVYFRGSKEEILQFSDKSNLESAIAAIISGDIPDPLKKKHLANCL